MTNSTMRVVNIPAMTVARFHGYGREPEDRAFTLMKEWMLGNDIDPGTRRIFGFNNPNPQPGSESYGYEFWVELSEPEKAPEVERIRFDGGRYAALRHDGNGETIPRTWKRLVELLAESTHDHAHHQWLEEHFIDFAEENEVFSLDCLAPIR